MIFNLKYNSIFAALAVFIVFSSCRTEPKSKGSMTTAKAPAALQMRLLTEPDALSPILSRKAEARQIIRHLYTRLLEVNPKTSKYEPMVAVSLPKVEILENGNQKFTFTIQPNAQWSDGAALTTQDILFSYKLLKHQGVKTRYVGIADIISDIQIDPANPNIISFTSDGCQLDFQSSMCEMFIYPEHIFDPEKTMRKIPFTTFLDKEQITNQIKNNDALAKVGVRFMDPEYVRDPNKFVTSNAYTFKEWITGQRIIIQKNKDWWGNKIDALIFKPQAEEIQFQIIPDNNTAITQLVNGELDALLSVPAVLYDENKNKENLQAKESPAYQSVWLALNNETGLLSDRLVRIALSHACNTESILKNALNGYASPITGPFMPETEMYNNEVPPIPFDIEKAAAILKAVGWSDSDQDGILDKMIDGKKTKLSLKFTFSNKSTTGPLIGEILKTDAKQAGIDIQILPGDYRKVIQNVKAADFDIFLTGSGFTAALYDPKGRWHTESFPPNGGNYARYGNKETDAMIDEIRSSCDKSPELINIYHRLHATLAADQPVIFLYNPKTLFLLNKKFDNVIVSPNRPGLFEEFLTFK